MAYAWLVAAYGLDSVPRYALRVNDSGGDAY
jgi:hypothetical protein